MDEDIVHNAWIIIGCLTIYAVARKSSKEGTNIEPVWRVIHRTCKLEDFEKAINLAKKEILGTFYDGPIPDLVSIINAQEIIRSRVGRVVVFSTKDLNNCYNVFSNSDWNCIQDRATFALVTDLKSYTGPCEVSFDIEILL